MKSIGDYLKEIRNKLATQRENQMDKIISAHVEMLSSAIVSKGLVTRESALRATRILKGEETPRKGAERY